MAHGIPSRFSSIVTGRRTAEHLVANLIVPDDSFAKVAASDKVVMFAFFESRPSWQTDHLTQERPRRSFSKVSRHKSHVNPAHNAAQKRNAQKTPGRECPPARGMHPVGHRDVASAVNRHWNSDNRKSLWTLQDEQETVSGLEPFLSSKAALRRVVKRYKKKI